MGWETVTIFGMAATESSAAVFWLHGDCNEKVGSQSKTLSRLFKKKFSAITSEFTNLRIYEFATYSGILRFSAQVVEGGELFGGGGAFLFWLLFKRFHGAGR